MNRADVLLAQPRRQRQQKNSTDVRPTVSSGRSHPLTANTYTATYRALAKQIARSQIEQVVELVLIGYPTDFDQATRKVVETTLWLAAERVLVDEDD